MYVRSNKRGNRTYYYIVKSEREDSKVKQRVVKYLGTAETLLEKIKKFEELTSD